MTALTAPARPAAQDPVVRVLDPTRAVAHRDVLHRVAMTLTRHPADAEDLVQETYAKVFARPRVIHDDDLSYLMRALRNVHTTSFRTAARRVRTAPLADGFEVPDTRYDTIPDAVAEARAVLAAVSDLKPDFRNALLAVDVAGLSYKQAAGLLGVKPATITSRLSRARAQVAVRFAAA